MRSRWPDDYWERLEVYEEWLDELKRGGAGWPDIYWKWFTKPEVQKYLLRVTELMTHGNGQIDALDVLQDSGIKITKEFRILPVEGFQPYTLTAIRHCVYEILRNIRRQSHHLEIVGRTSREVNPPHIRVEEDDHLAHLLTFLDENQRKTITDRLNGRTQTEIANANGVTRSAISQQIKKAIEIIRSKLG